MVVTVLLAIDVLNLLTYIALRHIFGYFFLHVRPLVVMFQVLIHLGTARIYGEFGFMSFL